MSVHYGFEHQDLGTVLGQLVIHAYCDVGADPNFSVYAEMLARTLLDGLCRERGLDPNKWAITHFTFSDVHAPSVVTCNVVVRRLSAVDQLAKLVSAT